MHLVRTSFLVLILSLMSLTSAHAMSDCEKALTLTDKPHDIRVIQVRRDYRLPSGRKFSKGSYRIQYIPAGIQDLDGLIGKGRVFTGFADMMSTVYRHLSNPANPLYSVMNFKYTEDSPGSLPVKFLFLDDHKRATDWDHLGFLPGDETSLSVATKQTRAVFKRLNKLRSKYSLEFVPSRLHVATPESLLQFYLEKYEIALNDVEGLKIRNVETEAEQKTNDLLNKVVEVLSFLQIKNKNKFNQHFVVNSPDRRFIDIRDLDNHDFERVNSLRAHVRAALTEAYVAMRLPSFQSANLTLREAFDQQILNFDQTAFDELERLKLLDREVDIITSTGIYEVKSAFNTDFNPRRQPPRPAVKVLDEAPSPKSEAIESTAVVKNISETTKAPVVVSPRLMVPPAMTSPEPVPEVIVEKVAPPVPVENRRPFIPIGERTKAQFNARKTAVDILKRHGVVPAEFETRLIYADGKIKTDLKDDSPAYGIVDIQN